MVKCTGRGLVVKRPGVLSKVQMLNLVLGVGVFSLLPTKPIADLVGWVEINMAQGSPENRRGQHVKNPCRKKKSGPQSYQAVLDGLPRRGCNSEGEKGCFLTL